MRNKVKLDIKKVNTNGTAKYSKKYKDKFKTFGNILILKPKAVIK